MEDISLRLGSPRGFNMYKVNIPFLLVFEVHGQEGMIEKGLLKMYLYFSNLLGYYI